MNGLGAYQTGIVALGSVAHMKRVTVRQIRRDVAGVGDWNIWAFLSQLDVVSVVFEAMRKQTSSALSTTRDGSKQHGFPPINKTAPILQTAVCASKWSICGNMCIVFWSSHRAQELRDLLRLRLCYSRD
jgi:hypothetical protein